MTSDEFKPIIERELSEYPFTIHFFIQTINSIMEASSSRLSIFKYEHIARYDKILYLDTDILINSDMNRLLDYDIASDKLYVIEEGNLRGDPWGWWLFTDPYINRETKAFSAGVMFFRNSHSMRDLFRDIEDYMYDYLHVKKIGPPACLEQPFIVYQAITQNKYDNQMLKAFLRNIYVGLNDSDPVAKDMAMFHFPGQIGNYANKSARMAAYWARMS
jgi:lipopolysaccharide biosynthesis glycosyltransferase